MISAIAAPRLSVRKSLLVSVVLSSFLLSACAPLLFGGAVMTGIAASDRRTAGAQLEDERIESLSDKRIRDNLGERVHINVTSYNRQALLTGEVPSEQDKLMAEQLVSKVENVRTVFNELAVTGLSTLGSRSSDAVVTTRVKANLIDAKDLSSNAYKIVTERGVVFLMGRVTAREADRATDLARRTNGVLKVVRIFEMITEEDLYEMQTPSTPQGKIAPGS